MDYSVYELIPLCSYYSNRKIIQMLHEYNTEYTGKHYAMCYHKDLNSTGKTWLSLKTAIVQVSAA